MIAPGFQLPPLWDPQALGRFKPTSKEVPPHLLWKQVWLLVLHSPAWEKGVYSHHSALSERKFELDMRLWCWGPSRYGLEPDLSLLKDSTQ